MLAVWKRDVLVYDTRVVERIDVDRRSVGHERVGLHWRLEGGVDVAVGSAEPDEHRVQVGGRERKKEVAVDRNLRLLRVQIGQRGLTDRFSGPTGRCQPEADTRNGQIDADYVHRDGSR